MWLMSVKDQRLDNVVETICMRGCRYVNAILDDMDIRSACFELTALDVGDRDQVLNELRCVMSVYQRAGSCCEV